MVGIENVMDKLEKLGIGLLAIMLAIAVGFVAFFVFAIGIYEPYDEYGAKGLLIVPAIFIISYIIGSKVKAVEAERDENNR